MNMAKKTISKKSSTNATFNAWLDHFEKTMINLGRVTPSTVAQYCTNYLPNLDVSNGNQTVKWLIDIIDNNSCATPLYDALAKFDAASTSFSVSSKTIADWRVAYKHFAQVILGIHFADVWFLYVSQSIELCKMVASNALFASKNVVDCVKAGKLGTKANLGHGNSYASWDNCSTQRCTYLKKGTVMPNGKIADDNTFANSYIKRAINQSIKHLFGKPYKFREYQVCHIWETSANLNYHTSIMNMVLLPKEIAAATDHVVEVQELLRYEAYNRFGINLSGKTTITMPSFYNQMKWRHQ